MIGAHICDGDFVIVKQQPVVEGGEIGAAIINDEATVKRIWIKGHKVRLIPENKRYKPLEINTKEDKIHIAGKVVGLIRKLF